MFASQVKAYQRSERLVDSEHHHHHHHYPSRQLAYRAATKLLHPCLSLASLWMLPQLWFMFFIFLLAQLFAKLRIPVKSFKKK